MTTQDTSLTGTYVLDPAATRLGFVARQAVVAEVRGAFESFAGRLHLDFADPGRSSAEVTVEVASLNTRNSRRDRHLLTGFFAAADHPRIAFRSTGARPLGADRFRLMGELTIKDGTRPVAVDMTYTGATDDGRGTVRAGFTGRATIDRRDWGVAWNAVLEGGGALVSNEVTLELEVTAVRTTR